GPAVLRVASDELRKCVTVGFERLRVQIASSTSRVVSPLQGGRNRVAESVAKRLSSVKHFGRYDRDLRRAARSPHDSTPHDRVNAGKRLLRGGGGPHSSSRCPAGH